MAERRLSFRRTPAWLPLAAVVGLGAWLLFVVEPLAGKLVLPVLGGSPAVWNTCLLFFQAMLLAGYAYVHFGTRWLGVRRHAALHAVVLLASILALPPELPAGWAPRADAWPIPELILVLTTTIGLPFFVLTTTAPLVQRWFASTTYAGARDPYFLYAASNTGSLLGLVMYPFVIEPWIGLGAQGRFWSGGYGAYGLFLVLTALVVWRGRGGAPVVEEASAGSGRGEGRTLRWIFLAFVPSALLLAVTSYVTTDIAPVPLLWMLPLALYLGSFILAFARPDSRLLPAMAVLQVPLLLLIGGLLVLDRHPVWALPLHLPLFAITAYVAHGTLARERPPTQRLTAYYLWISVGGALGGVFGVLLAPLVFMPTTEYLLLLVLAALARPREATARRVSWRVVATGLALAALLVAGARVLGGQERAWLFAAAPLFLMITVAITWWRGQPAALAAAFGAAFVAMNLVVPKRGEVLARDRNFFGTTTVVADARGHALMHGRTLHGMQDTDPARWRMPTTYYSEAGPFGDVIGTLGESLDGRRIAIVGLGVGVTACYGRAGQTWDFYEINPAVVRFARDTAYFRFLDECAPAAPVILGDARLRMSEQPAGRYALIILDAFTSDAVPVHLITREAFALYRSRLEPGGVLLVNLSNKYLDLEPVVADHAAGFGWTAFIRRDRGPGTIDHFSSIWAVLSADGARLEPLAARPGWSRIGQEAGFRTWTDDYSNVLSVLTVTRLRSAGPAE